MPNTLTDNQPNGLISQQNQTIYTYLENSGLPYDNIIAPVSEIEKISLSINSIINKLSPETKRNAKYLSKFIVGTATGLFDYALNAIWNEVVINLRKKVVLYGIDIFFDTALGGGRNRVMYQNEEDLNLIKDATLLDACLKLELIRDVTFLKLKHILNMRNNIGISHPTEYDIGAFELLGWLEVCVKDVLNDQPTEDSLKVKQFIENIKNKTEKIDDCLFESLKKHLSAIPTHFSASILITVFGIYNSKETSPIARQNIAKIAPIIWKNCKDEARYKLGIVLEGYKINLQEEKYDLGDQFFVAVNGNAYKSTSEKSIILSELLNNLREKHNGWDNFHHETPIIREIASYIPNISSLPDNIADLLFKSIFNFRVGNGVSYNDGVSPGAKKYYDNILKLVGDKYADKILEELTTSELKRKLSMANCRKQAKLALEIIAEGIGQERYKEAFSILINKIETHPTIIETEEFKRLFT